VLYHVTATHSPDNCPLYDPDMRDDLEEGMTATEDMARELGVTILFLVTAAPDHVFYSLLEADDFTAIQRVLTALPMRQEFTITPVVSLQDARETLLGS
jgi:muconolactone delta-isomerase